MTSTDVGEMLTAHFNAAIELGRALSSGRSNNDIAAAAKKASADIASALTALREALDAVEEIPGYNVSDHDKIRLILLAVKRARATLADTAGRAK